MDAKELQNKFIAIKKFEPIDNNDLLDFARQYYIQGQLTILEYRNIVRELELTGARKPEYMLDEMI
ncbi:YppF family protein [Bacillus timonensis]|nr:YppF family protein [Bacillus timonensis]